MIRRFGIVSLGNNGLIPFQFFLKNVNNISSVFLSIILREFT